MKILFTIHHHLNPNSGVGGSTLQLGREYQKLGHQVTYYSYDNLPPSLPEIAKYLLFPWWLGFYLWQNHQQFEVVDASTGDTWIWGKLISKRIANPPLLVTRSHGLEHFVHRQNQEDAARGDLSLSWKYYLYRGSLHLWQVTQSLVSADLVLLLNQEEYNYAQEVLGLSPQKMSLISNGIPDYFLDLPLLLLPPEEKTIRIAQIGTFIPRKGIKYSIPALDRILKKYLQINLSFFGTACPECPSPKEVETCFSPEVRDRLQVIPTFPHRLLPQLLQGHQIKLLPSLAEGFGLGLIEAMACGLAPVVTATGGPLDIVSDRHDGLVVPLRDSEAIFNALEKLIGDRTELNRLQQNAHQTAQNYSWQKIAQDTLNLYQKAIERKSQKRQGMPCLYKNQK